MVPVEKLTIMDIFFPKHSATGMEVLHRLPSRTSAFFHLKIYADEYFISN
jgi:hypothetical protein